MMTSEGAAVVRAEWRYHDAEIVAVDHRSAGPDLKPSGAPNRTHDIEPHAGAADFDDAAWDAVAPTALQDRRSTGRLCFGWYRLRLNIPERVAGFDTRGSTAVFEIVLDDYAEVWVDGRQPQIIGQAGGPMAAGWNAPNRVVVGRDLEPGRQVQLAVFAANGPLSDPPANYVWVRSATLDFYQPDRYAAVRAVPHELTPVSEAVETVVPRRTVVEQVAEGLTFAEGPVWVPARVAGAGGKPIDEGYLLFSDPNRNVIYRLTQDGETFVFRTKSGYSGVDISQFTQPGSNGLALDGQGRLTVCEHGNRRVVRIEHNGRLTILADRFEGRRLNSPNDLVYRSDGALYFTDPPFGLPRLHEDPRRELAHTGVYCLRNGQLRLVSSDLNGPNGLAFSRDEKFLYITNWDPERKIVMRYAVQPDGDLQDGIVFFDMTAAKGEEALDGLEVDGLGNLFVSGPGGVWIISADGTHLGTLELGELPSNFAWGGDDARTLYMTARTSVYRMRLPIGGHDGASRREAAAIGELERFDPRWDAIFARDAKLEVVADGYTWLEGPTWDTEQQCLYFSDIPRNSVYRWKEGAGARLFLTNSGYSGEARFAGREPGSNGLALDSHGRLILCEHGNRRLTRLEQDGTRTVLADLFQGKRLNSPNDCVVAAGGDVLFTDPPFGLPRTFDDPAKELDYSGVYRLRPGGGLTLLTRELKAPNGLAFSPDGGTLYVSNADRENPVWMAFPVSGDGSLGQGQVFASARPWVVDRAGAPDGLKVDRRGNLFCAGPGGVYVFDPNGSHLGTIVTGTATSNCAWGDDGSVLYITAATRVLRIATKTGIRNATGE
ncbi:MAG: SMP-30/gluconolactonase/LRE family protein [Planctomycetes bacterium]|nr:SMP-30/gluconolactonase/LRE family protein [Planctomycetota bacterium]